MTKVHVAILAAGQGTRMKSALPKVLHRVAGKPMIDYALRLARGLDPATITLIVGHRAALVRTHLGEHDSLQFALQEPQLGTAHALLQAEGGLAGRSGTLVLLSGDVPFLGSLTLARLIATHSAAGAAATVVTALVDRPYGYGRVVRTKGRLTRIVEERDASPAERAIREINAGVYAFDLAPLWDALRGIASQNAQGEYYLTDLIAAYRRRKLPLETLLVENPQEIRGINSRSELAEVSRIVRQQKNEEVMASGVTLVDPASTYIEDDVEIGADTVIHPGVILEGRTRIGSACEIHANVRISGSVVGDRVTVNNFCVIVGAQVADGASVGPFAHLRPDTTVGAGARVGNFVELKKTSLGPGSKVSHLSYIGDATIGAHVNVGAGTITCNYDGTRKHETVIDDDAFIGSDTQLIAPVRVGKGAYVGAGSSITKDVPPGALGIGRARQTNIEGWAARRKTPGKTS
ncbi:MAG: bifunctional UDP-N-acetylglucosamine diphosphorylase/glucosamine-1-phosphate N-acetyltransferase GlmU [Acidobacteria bacterium]|nr:bifunctional UDP-N-acetylglucosamine diphosphorylase/glucosamine-1-phosphate N-acetyltransferase GlmU [Acidobacteriota bacterium]